MTVRVGGIAGGGGVGREREREGFEGGGKDGEGREGEIFNNFKFYRLQKEYLF